MKFELEMKSECSNDLDISFTILSVPAAGRSVCKNEKNQA